MPLLMMKPLVKPFSRGPLPHRVVERERLAGLEQGAVDELGGAADVDVAVLGVGEVRRELETFSLIPSARASWVVKSASSTVASTSQLPLALGPSTTRSRNAVGDVGRVVRRRRAWPGPPCGLPLTSAHGRVDRRAVRCSWRPSTSSVSLSASTVGTSSPSSRLHRQRAGVVARAAAGPGTCRRPGSPGRTRPGWRTSSSASWTSSSSMSGCGVGRARARRRRPRRGTPRRARPRPRRGRPPRRLGSSTWSRPAVTNRTVPSRGRRAEVGAELGQRRGAAASSSTSTTASRSSPPV